MKNGAIKASVAYATALRQVWLDVELKPGATLLDAIEKSGVLTQFSEIDLAIQKVGIFGKPAKLDDVLSDGDRVEIYRAITADPKAVKRKRAGGGRDDDAPAPDRFNRPEEARARLRKAPPQAANENIREKLEKDASPAPPTPDK